MKELVTGVSSCRVWMDCQWKKNVPGESAGSKNHIVRTRYTAGGIRASIPPVVISP